jgi:methionyl-tRNA formyltransferase
MSEKLRIAFFGDGAWAAKSVTGLLENGHDISAVVLRTNPSDSTLQDLAIRLGLKIFRPNRVNDAQFVREIEGLYSDLNISVSYNQILGDKIRETTPLGFVNFHAGKLPHYRGRNVINWALINGEEEIGITAHFVDGGIDTGDIILQRTLPMSWTDTYGSVLGRVQGAFPQLVCDAVELVASGSMERTKQAHLVGSYFSGRQTGDEWIDWSDTSRNIYNFIRAITHPGPGAKTLLSTQEVKVWQAYYDPSWTKYRATPGEVIGRRSDGVLIKTGDSLLLLQEIETSDGFAEVPKWRIGTRLAVNCQVAMPALIERINTLEAALQGVGK